MLILPAIDIRGGRCVRLTRGLPEEEKVYADDPVAVARAWAAEGAPWLHVVDLDGAFAGKPCHLDLVAEIVRAAGIPVQFGGGLRTFADVAAAFAAGVARVVLGTAAFSDPDLVARACTAYGEERVVVSIDARSGKAAVAGWQEVTPRTALELALAVKEKGVRRVVFTDAERDGTLAGPNLEAIRALARSSGLRVIASGGVGSLADIARLKELEPEGVEGVILGKALYEGRFRLAAALAVARGNGGSCLAGKEDHPLP